MALPSLPAESAARLDALLRHYACLQGLPHERLVEDLAREARWLEAPAGTPLFDEGRPCGGFPFVLDGEVRVLRASAGGRALELYRVAPGEVCLLSACCLFGAAVLPAQGETTQPTRLLVLSPAAFERWAAHAPFRRYLFGLFAERLAELMALSEAVAFQRLDQRLAAALLGQGPALHTTHQQLAERLGTVREIVSRLLERFEREGWVRLGRERIEIVDAVALRRLAQGALPS
ncbi:Crp/Fnr family transcriptional regulator [Caldimonas tepidiphila]|uniref:Crp/Fnr family transcriptional regulator n=1 Tax=Caldimonas tepidiphila TaxID=2315841 RepID=UPI000E5BD00A|nr:Crp/Fnr family transcriptional regulator [Caldimonas tepidiphila]